MDWIRPHFQGIERLWYGEGRPWDGSSPEAIQKEAESTTSTPPSWMPACR